MTEPLIESPRTSSNGTTANADPAAAAGRDPDAHSRIDPEHDTPPATPRWVKAFGIVLVVLLLAFAALHRTGNAPTHMGSGDTQHGFQMP
jgi:hypothetical protein